MISVGDITIEPIFDGTARLMPDMWDGSDWTAHQHLLDDAGQLVVPVGAFLVRTGDRIVLMDAGVGDVNDDMFDGGRLLDSLRAAGAEPGDIDTIVVSHLHSDHMGWLELDGRSVFPNAAINIGAADWEYFVEQAGGGRKRAGRLRAIESQVTLIHAEGHTIAPGITSLPTPGHTPGHLSSVISHGDDRLIVLGDALHCPAQLTEPEWEFLYDVDKALAKRSRRMLLERAETSDSALLPCHFPGMQAARLLPARAESARTWSLDG